MELFQATQQKPPPYRDYLSFSAIRTYQGCPLRYAFKYVMGLPETMVAANLLLGIGIHAALEAHFRAMLVGEALSHDELPIDRRTCKHIRQVRGDGAEEARLGATLPGRPSRMSTPAKAPPLLLAQSWDGTLNPAGWFLSEKLDGTRAYWDGRQFLSRQGNRFFAPDWFVAGLPLEPLDGELWIGRKQFQRTVSIVRRQDGGDLCKEVRFLVFDAPAHDGPFEERMDLVNLIMTMNRPAYAQSHAHELCQGIGHLETMLVYCAPKTGPPKGVS